MLIKSTNLEGVKIIEPPTIFHDHRGDYIETYNKGLYYNNDIKIDFIQDDISISQKNVLRGIHGDSKTWKLISCIYGEIFVIIVNNDPKSKQYNQYEHFIISDKNNYQILVPPLFGNGHLVLSDKCIFHYKQSTYYNRNNQFTILWNDPKYNFKWPIKNPILSKRDLGHD